MDRLRNGIGIIMLAALFNGAIVVPTASACPMCKSANETQSELPRAYQYSILFMLAMPATIFTGIGVGLYRMSKREAEVAERMDRED
ncbi:MAG: hypothetical protein O2955_04850 [Planctomycetota bacterium]|nr:hypothetical protein [Planctomycetota bacterium]MDA1211820.1 hypothetical protein [Planctomycetota bacterium]